MISSLSVVATVAVAVALPAPAAAAGATTVVAGNARFQVITPTLVRLEYASDRRFEDRPSLNAIDRDHGEVDVEQEVDGDTLTLRTSALTLQYTGTGAFDERNLRLTLRVGGRTRTVAPSFTRGTPGNLGGWHRGLDQARGPVPLHPGLLSRDGFHLLDDSATALLADGEPGFAVRPGGRTYQDGYLFAYGHDYARGLADLRALTGAAPLLPRKAFGTWFSRYADISATEYRDRLLPRFRAERVPLDVLVVDTDFKAPDPWNGWGWSGERFADPRGFVAWAQGEGLDVALNVHPSISANDPRHAATDVAAGGLKEDRFFDWAEPADVGAYFDLHAPFEADGVDLWWLDWCCDGSRARAPGLTPDAWINELYHRRSAARGKRWPVLSRIGAAFDRYGDAGRAVWAEHRNAVHFTGDAFDTWDMLDFQTRFTVGEGNLGIPYVSHDIGSFHGRRLPDDLYLRWIQAGVVGPINRLHSSSREGARLPWEYRGRTRRLAADLLRLRTELVPFLYTLARAAHDTGLPIARASYLAHPEHEDAYAHTGQYLLGDDVLVAPVGTPGDPATKRVWFPPGAWTDLFTGEVHRGPAVKDLAVPLERMPVFVRAGGIVPLQEAGERAGTAPPAALRLRVQAGGDGGFTLYDDEGDGLGYREGRFARTPLRWSERARTLTIGAARGRFPGQPATRSYAVEVVGVDAPEVVAVAGAVVSGWRYDAARRTLTVATGPRSTGEETAVVLRAGPAPARVDAPSAVFPPPR